MTMSVFVWLDGRGKTATWKLMIVTQTLVSMEQHAKCVYLLHIQRRRKDVLIGGAQSDTTHRVVNNLYNNL